MSLYHETTDLHHDAEKHPFGERMATGTLTMQEWSDWLWAIGQLHDAIDPYLPASLKRGHEIRLDLLRLLPIKPNPSPAAKTIVSQLDDPQLAGGLCYILSGANLRGGQVIRKVLEPKGFPCGHLTFTPADAADGDGWLKRLREITEMSDGAREAFIAVLSVMDEIEGRTHSTYQEH